jgi:hypothetical protein
MAAKRTGAQYIVLLEELIAISEKIESGKDLKFETSVLSAITSLIYAKGE